MNPPGHFQTDVVIHVVTVLVFKRRCVIQVRMRTSVRIQLSTLQIKFPEGRGGISFLTQLSSYSLHRWKYARILLSDSGRGGLAVLQVVQPVDQTSANLILVANINEHVLEWIRRR